MSKKHDALTQIRLYSEVKDALEKLSKESYPEPSLQAQANSLLYQKLVEMGKIKKKK